MSASFNVLFLCYHNSARSLMAEAILQKVGEGAFNVYSAGAEPAAQPNQHVIKKLEILGHDVSALRSKSWNDFTGPDAPKMDFVIALCDITEGQKCPEFGENPVTASWPLPDPSKFEGTDIERDVMLNELYSMLTRRLEIFNNLPFSTLDRMGMKARLDELGYKDAAA